MSIPRAMLQWLDWLPGQAVILEMTEDKSVIVRKPRATDFGPVMPSRIVFPESDEPKL